MRSGLAAAGAGLAARREADAASAEETPPSSDPRDMGGRPPAARAGANGRRAERRFQRVFVFCVKLWWCCGHIQASIHSVRSQSSRHQGKKPADGTTRSLRRFLEMRKIRRHCFVRATKGWVPNNACLHEFLTVVGHGDNISTSPSGGCRGRRTCCRSLLCSLGPRK